MGKLCNDIIFSDILPRLPPKSIGRAKCVCKQWLAQLSTQRFVHDHCRHMSTSINQKILTITDQSVIITDVSVTQSDHDPTTTIIQLPFNARYNEVLILSSLDGLLCISVNSTGELLLWNPISRAYKKLPNNDYVGLYKGDRDAIGMYVDASNNYNVLHISRFSHGIVVFVYSRRTHSWRQIPFLNTNKYNTKMYSWSPGVLCKDKLFFTASEYWVGGQNTVIAYDVNLETFMEISFPDISFTGICRGHLVSVKNEIQLFVTYGYPELNVSLWKLDGVVWCKVLAFPDIRQIEISKWCSITHVKVKGKWFFNADCQQAFEVDVTEEYQPLYPKCWLAALNGSVFFQTILSP